MLKKPLIGMLCLLIVTVVFMGIVVKNYYTDVRTDISLMEEGLIAEGMPVNQVKIIKSAMNGLKASAGSYVSSAVICLFIFISNGLVIMASSKERNSNA